MAIPLHFDGFYFSGPCSWEDWHAGVRMHGTRFHFTRFYANGDWVSCYRNTGSFPFWDFTEGLSADLIGRAKRDRAPRIADADPLCTAGTYTIDGDCITEVFAPDWTGGASYKSTWRIQIDRLDQVLECGKTVAMLFKPKPSESPMAVGQMIRRGNEWNAQSKRSPSSLAPLPAAGRGEN